MIDDAFIDEVAGGMTAADPSGAFRARVIAHLGPAPSRPAIWLRRAAPLAAAVVVTAAVWFARTAPDSQFPAHAPAIAGLTPAAPPLLARSVEDDPDVRAGRRPRAAVPAEELAWLARAVPPLPETPRLTIDAIQPAWLSIAPITVDQLVAEPLELAPLESRAGDRH